MERRGSWNELRGTPSFKEQIEEKQPEERSKEWGEVFTSQKWQQGPGEPPAGSDGVR